MKNIILFLSTAFLCSSGLAASSEERDSSSQQSWVRAAAVKTDQEKYEILSDAEDHIIKLPLLASVTPELQRIHIMVPYLLEKSLRELFEESKNSPIPLIQLKVFIMQGASSLVNVEEKVPNHKEMRQILENGYFLSAIFMIIYNKSEKIYLKKD